MRTKYFKRAAFLLLGCLLMFLLSGCMAFDIVLNINEDGAGKLIYDVLWKVEYADQATGELPEGTTKVDIITIEGQDYTGYRVSKSFSTLDELKAILLEKSGDDEFTIDEESGLRSASAFRLGNFIESVDIVKNDVDRTMDLRMVFSAIDLASVVAQEGQNLENKDIFTLYFNISMPGNIVNASSNLANITLDGGSAKVSFSPDKQYETTLNISSDYSGNVYIYSDRQPPKESYVFTGDAEANKKQDEETRAQIAADPINQPADPDGPSGTLMYIAVALVFIVVGGLVLVWKLKHVTVDPETDKAYQRKLKRDERIAEEYNKHSKPLQKGSGKGNKNGKNNRK